MATDTLLFFGNSWHVFSAGLIFSIGLATAFIQKNVFEVKRSRAISLYLWHSFFCIFYFWYSLNNTADSTLYYMISYSYGSGFNFGTAGIYYFVSFFTQVLNLSYGNVFLIFNIVGYIGLLSFASALQSVTTGSRFDVRKYSALLLYLPGMSFWSTAIGKDALTFMAAGLITWAVLDVTRRWPAVAVSALFFLVPRPHMAGVLLLAFSLALLVSSNLGIYKKISLLIVAIPVSLIAVQFGLNYAGLGDASDLSDVGDYFEVRQGHNLGGGSSLDIAGMSLPLRLFTYLFRPLMFDAAGILGLVVSIENLILLFLTVGVVFRKKRTKSVLGRFEIVFFLTFVLISWFILANTTANLGIAIRQKTMFLPMLIVLLLSFWQGGRKQPLSKRR